MKRLLLPALLVLATACSSATATSNSDVTGVWKTQIGDLVIVANVTQSGSTLSGTVTFTDGGGSRSGQATGTFHSPDVSWTLTDGSGGSVTFGGVLINHRTMQGRADSDGLTPPINDAATVFVLQ